LYIHLYDKPIAKTIYQAINVTTTEVELLAIRCGINQAVNIPNIKHIIVIIDSIHAVKIIFDSLSHSYQIHSAAISHELREFFRKDINNYIEFWDCSSKVKWSLYLSVDSNTKRFPTLPTFPYKLSWNFCKKHNNESILNL